MNRIDGADDRQRTEALWREQHLNLRRFCVAIAGVADGDELAVDVFLRCAPKILAGRVDSPRSYLRRAALNSVRNLHRSRRREVLGDVDRHSGAPVRSTMMATSSEFGDVRHAIGDLSPRQRAVVYLAYWEGFSEREIAEQLGIAHGTVRRLMHRAHNSLRSELA